MTSRRASSARQPSSPDVTLPAQPTASSFKQAVADDKAASEVDSRKRSTSVTSFLNRFRPSHRPERGGTIRDHGFWEDLHERQAAARPNSSHIALSSPKPFLRPRHGSDSIASSAWNQPIDLPRRTQTYQGQREKLRGPPSAYRPVRGTVFKTFTHGQEKQSLEPVHADQTAAARKPGQRKAAKTVKANNTAMPQSFGEGATLKRTTVQETFALFDQKREARRLRQSLKESSDFLGVQGVNPHTGVMDVITPTSSSPSDNTMRSLPELKPYSETMTDFRTAYQRARRSQDAEEASLVLLKKEQERAARLQRHKDTIRAFQRRVRWQKDQHQWSSVAEPDLSPIVDLSVKTPSTTGEETRNIPPRQPVQNPHQDKHSHSNSPVLQTTKPAPALVTPPTTPPLERPEILARDSSGTVIHTPVNNKTSDQRRFSVIAEILGNGNQPSSSPEASRRASEPSNSLQVSHCPPTEPRLRRKPISSPESTTQPSKLKLIIPTDQAYDIPLPDQLEHAGSFLGKRIWPVPTPTKYFLDPAPDAQREIRNCQIYPQAPVCKENSRASIMPPSAQVEGYADEKNRQVAFHNHLSHLDRPAVRPPVPIFTSTQEANVSLTAQQKRKSLRLRRPSLVSHRLGSGAKDLENQPHEDTEALNAEQRVSSQLDLPHKSPRPDMVVRSPTLPVDRTMSGTMTKDAEPTSQWATQLIQDIEVLSGGPEKKLESFSVKTKPPEVCSVSIVNLAAIESACTRTTTITGYEANPLQNAQKLLKGLVFDGPGDNVSRDDPVIPNSTPSPDKITVQVTEKADEIADETLKQGGEVVKEVTAAPVTKIPHASSPSPRTPNTSDRLPFPPSATSNIWPKLVIPPLPSHLRPVTAPAVTKPRPANPRTASYPRPCTAPGPRPTRPGNGITSSAHQLRPTRERYNRLCRRGSSLNRLDITTDHFSRAISSTEASRGRSRDRASIRSDATMSGGRRAASPMSTSIYLHPHNHSLTSSLVSLRGNNTSSTSLDEEPVWQGQPATEAARTALLAHPPSMKVKIVQVARKGSTASERQIAAMIAERDQMLGRGKMERESKDGKGSEDDEDGTEDLSRNKKEVVKKFPLEDGEGEAKGEQFVPLSKRSVDLLIMFLVGYWTLVAPVFNAASPISRRLSAHQSTLHDCMVYLLALVFVLVGFLLAVWTVKGTVVALRGIRAVGGGLGALVGF